MFVEADPFRDDGCKDREPARNEHGMRSIGPHGLNQHTSARRQGDFVGDHVQDGGAVEALEKGDTLAQRRFEGDFAAHRAFGDRGDLGPLADFSGEFVDTFLADHGRIHVGQQELLAPPLRPLHDDIDGSVIESGAHPIRDGSCAAAGPGSKAMSAAIQGSSQFNGPGRLKASLARRSISLVKTGNAGSQTSVATCVMGRLGLAHFIGALPRDRRLPWRRDQLALFHPKTGIKRNSVLNKWGRGEAIDGFPLRRGPAIPAS